MSAVREVVELGREALSFGRDVFRARQENLRGQLRQAKAVVSTIRRVLRAGRVAAKAAARQRSAKP